MKKTVFILIDTLGGGGAERRALITAKSLSNDYNVKIVIFDSRFISYEIPCDIIDLNIPIKNNKIMKVIDQFTRAINLKRLRQYEKPIAVISFGPAANRANCFSSGVGKTIISLTSFTQAQKCLINQFIYSWADSIICQTIAMKEYLLRGYPTVKEKVITINNGLDLDYIQEQARAKPTDLNFTYSDYVTVGRLDYIKGYQHLIQAFSIVLKNLPSATLTIIGEGEIKKELESLAKSLRISEHISFRGFLENPFALESRCGVYVMSSISEGFPNALVEAMACGIPVISTDCKSGPREILSNNYVETSTNNIEYTDYGVLVPPFSSKEIEPEKHRMLADAMYHLATDQALRDRYSALARERAKEFTVNNYISQIKNLLD